MNCFQHFPEATRAHYSLPFTLLAAMTMLCREKETRKQWQRRQDVMALVTEMEEHYQTLSYVKEVLALLDDKELLVLDPLNKRGFQDTSGRRTEPDVPLLCAPPTCPAGTLPALAISMLSRPILSRYATPRTII